MARIISRGTRKDDVPIVKCVEERIMDSIAIRFPATNALDCGILHIQSQNVPRVIHTDLSKRSGVWTQTPISA